MFIDVPAVESISRIVLRPLPETTLTITREATHDRFPDSISNARCTIYRQPHCRPASFSLTWAAVLCPAIYGTYISQAAMSNVLMLVSKTTHRLQSHKGFYKGQQLRPDTRFRCERTRTLLDLRSLGLVLLKSRTTMPYVATATSSPTLSCCSLRCFVSRGSSRYPL